jgi:hypothetical protein
LLNREIFYTLKEAQIMIERWRQEYKAVRLHSALGYRSPSALLLLFLDLMITNSSLGLFIIFASVRELISFATTCLREKQEPVAIITTTNEPAGIIPCFTGGEFFLPQRAGGPGKQEESANVSYKYSSKKA